MVVVVVVVVIVVVVVGVLAVIVFFFVRTNVFFSFPVSEHVERLRLNLEPLFLGQKIYKDSAH